MTSPAEAAAAGAALAATASALGAGSSVSLSRAQQHLHSLSLRLVTEQQNTGHSTEERNSQTNHITGERAASPESTAAR